MCLPYPADQFRQSTARRALEVRTIGLESSAYSTLQTWCVELAQEISTVMFARSLSLRTSRPYQCTFGDIRFSKNIFEVQLSDRCCVTASPRQVSESWPTHYVFGFIKSGSTFSVSRNWYLMSFPGKVMVADHVADQTRCLCRSSSMLGFALMACGPHSSMQPRCPGVHCVAVGGQIMRLQKS